MCICHHCIFSIVYAVLHWCLSVMLHIASVWLCCVLALELRGEAKHLKYVTEIVTKAEKNVWLPGYWNVRNTLLSGLGTCCFLKLLIHSPPVLKCWQGGLHQQSCWILCVLAGLPSGPPCHQQYPNSIKHSFLSLQCSVILLSSVTFQLETSRVQELAEYAVILCIQR